MILYGLQVSVSVGSVCIADRDGTTASEVIFGVVGRVRVKFGSCS